MPEVETKTVAEWQAAGVLRVEDGNHGEYRPRPDEFSEAGVAFIRAADLDAGTVSFASASKINDVALGRITKGVGAPGDVLFSHKGTVGKLALVPDEAPQFVCSPQTTFWRVTDRDRVDPRYLYYYMQSWQFRQQWEACKGETDMADYVSLTAQRRLSVSLPPRHAQDRVVEMLFALDEGIDVNRKMNRTLDAMARVLFKSWFVDFDPVVAKREGRQPFGMDAETANLFPAHFAESELGPIPEGWTVSKIGNEVKVFGGSTPRTNVSEYWLGGLHCWVTPRDLSRLSDPVVLDSERKITDAGLAQISSGLLPAGTVLLSSRAPIGYTAIAAVPLAVNQGFIAMRCADLLGPQFVLQWTQDSMGEIVARAGGTTFAEISKTAFRPIPLVVPSENVARAYEAQVGLWHEQIVANVRQSAMLMSLRELLLPKLLSGEIQFKNAKKAVADVA